MNNYKVVLHLEKKKWSEFVFNHPNGNIFQTPEMFKVYKKTKNYEPVLIAVVDNNENIFGVLLAVIQKEYDGFIGNFTARSLIQGGPLIKEDNPVILNIVLENYNKIIQKKVIYSQFRNMWDMLSQNDIFQENGYFFKSHLNYIFLLKNGEKYIWDRIKKNRKKHIRRAIKNGLVVKVHKNNIDENIIKKGYEIIKEVYKNAKIPFADISLFQNANKNGILIVFTVEFQDAIIGCRFALGYKKLIYGWFAGSFSKYYYLFPNELLIWKTLEWSINNNYDYFDYGGAGNPNKPYGVRKFKSQLGGLLVNYGRYEKIHKSFLFIIGKIGLKFWQIIKYLK